MNEITVNGKDWSLNRDIPEKSIQPWHSVTHEERVARWENALRVLDNMNEHERKKHFDMSTWGVNTACGTVACLAGHCGLDPWFQERGLVLRLGKRGTICEDFGDMANRLFGTDGMRRIFVDGASNYDILKREVEDFIVRLKMGQVTRNDSSLNLADINQFDLAKGVA